VPLLTPVPTRVGSRVISTGSYRPEQIVTNDEIAALIDSSDEWIRERSGIIERRRCAPGESLTDMAVAAGAKAIAGSAISADKISMVLVATVTHPYQTPAAAPEVAFRLGALDAAATDLSAACAGFCYSLGLADSMIRAGTAEYVLVIGVEKFTDFVSPTDRGTAFIFGDGAGAVLVGPSDHTGIGPTIWGADGEQKDLITMSQSWSEYRLEPRDEFPYVQMSGQQVFRWAVGDIPKIAMRTLEASGITVDDLAAFIPHQANMRITDSIVRALKLPEHVVIGRDIETTGNTSAASIPLALDRLRQADKLPSGGLALLIGFGAGLAYAAQVIELP
jgi:3-oxoacyl-[acyl-carrier-protein] synthase-3